MKFGPFIEMIARELAQPVNSVKVYGRLLREGGLLTSTGARGPHGPDMTPLDAARMVLAILATDSPSQAVERVRRFGTIKYSPQFSKAYAWYEVIQPDEFAAIFEGETLEDVLANILALPAKIGVTGAAEWFVENAFHLRVNDFDVLADLHSWRMEGRQIVAERVVPFKGQVLVPDEKGGIRHVKGFTPIRGHVRTERVMTCASFLEIGVSLTPDTSPP